MSYPTRYMSNGYQLEGNGYYCLLTQSPIGEFVRWEDYARLKAEVERLTSNLLGRDATIMGLDSTIKCRDAEVERLRKAGDAMCKFFDDHGFYGFEFQEAWNAAKEGKQP